MGREVVFITADRIGWTLVHKGKRLGPYATERDAIYVAQLWAEGARRQGIMLEFSQESESFAQLFEPRSQAATVLMRRPQGEAL